MESEKRLRIFLFIAILVIVGLLIYFLILPKYNSKLYNQGYTQATLDLANSRALPIVFERFNQETNMTESKIEYLPICSEEFIQAYKTICGGGQ